MNYPEEIRKETAGNLVKKYFDMLGVGENTKIEEFVSLITMYFKDNCFLLNRESWNCDGKSTLPACFVKIEDISKRRIIVLDKDLKIIRLNKNSAAADKSSLDFLSTLNSEGWSKIAISLAKEELEFEFLDDNRNSLIIFPDFLREYISKKIGLNVENI